MLLLQVKWPSSSSSLVEAAHAGAKSTASSFTASAPCLGDSSCLTGYPAHPQSTAPSAQSWVQNISSFMRILDAASRYHCGLFTAALAASTCRWSIKVWSGHSLLSGLHPTLQGLAEQFTETYGMPAASLAAASCRILLNAHVQGYPDLSSEWTKLRGASLSCRGLEPVRQAYCTLSRSSACNALSDQSLLLALHHLSV